MPRCRPLGWIAAFALLSGCGGADAPCLIDSDCADLTRVCNGGRCVVPGSTPRDGGLARDAGPARRDAAPAIVDSGVATDAALDAEPADAGGPTCTDVVGAWQISALVAEPCSGAMVGYVVNLTAGGAECTFNALSADVFQPAMDGSFVTDATDTFLLASSTLSLGGAAPVNCSGNVAGGVLSVTCDLCTLSLAPVP